MTHWYNSSWYDYSANVYQCRIFRIDIEKGRRIENVYISTTCIPRC